MNKADLLRRLELNRDYNPRSGSWHFREDSDAWADAFNYYNAVHGLTPKEGVRLNCGQCFHTVKDWLTLPPKHDS